MTAMTQSQNSFTSGEITPLLHNRTDYQRFASGVRTARGFVPLPQGPITRAPGTIYLGETKDNLPARLISFEFAEDDALNIELTAGTLRVWRYGALVESSGSPYEASVPWSTIGEIRAIDTEQSADVIYCASPDRMIQTLSRAALDDWSVDELDVATGPFKPVNLETGDTVQCDDTTGSITITLSDAAILETGHEGALLRIEVEDYNAIPLWTADQAITAGDQRRYDGRIYEFVSGTSTGGVPPTHLTGTRLMDSVSNAKWTYISGAYGIVRLTSQDTTTSWTAEVLLTIPEPCVSDPTYRWAIGAWSDVDGYPRSVAIYDEHLFAAGTTAAPRTFWFSVLGGFDDFEAGTAADLGGGYTIPGSVSLNAIQWLYPASDGLLIGALGEVFRIFPPDSAASIGPTNIRRALEAPAGVSGARPIFPVSYPVMIAKGDQRLLELRRGSNGEPNPVPLSLPAQHIAARGMSEIVWQGGPFATAWIPLSDAGLAAMVYLPDQEVLGWATVPVAGGTIESITVTPHPEEGREVITLVVAREIDGSTRYFVEELADNRDALEGGAPAHTAVHLYASTVFVEDPATDTFSLPHLEGEDVWAWTDQGSFGPITVGAGGAVTLDAEVGYAVIGLYDDSHELETLAIQPDAPDGSAKGRNTRLHSGGGLVLHRTAGGTVQVVERDFAKPVRTGAARELIQRDVLSENASVYSGTLPLDLPSGLAHEVSLLFKPRGGMPLTLAGVAPPIEEAGA